MISSVESDAEGGRVAGAVADEHLAVGQGGGARVGAVGADHRERVLEERGFKVTGSDLLMVKLLAAPVVQHSFAKALEKVV